MAADTTPIDFVVDKTELRHCEWAPADASRTLDPGDIELRIERFALTSNNITYAKFGDAIGYWRFFPAPPGKGRIPVWGIGVVERSRCAEIAVGETLYGYLPMSSHVRLQPGSIKANGFIDAAPHRAELPRTYNEYRRIDHDPTYDAAHADAHLVLRPLFSLSFFLAEHLRDEGVFGARRVLVTSASSKTALGLAQMLRTVEGAANGGVALIGLTSTRNLDFVRTAGTYHDVVAYDAIDALPFDEPVVIVDIAGDAGLLRRLHQRLGETIRCSCLVGATHDAPVGTAPDTIMPGPKPAFFFTPHHIVERRRLWREAQLASRLGAAWQAFVADVPRWLTFRHSGGRAAVERVYAEVLSGAAPPDRADILTIGAIQGS